MTTIIMSLHPKWWPQILSGEKTLEIRKTEPHPVYYPLRVVVYLTAPVRRIVGEFTCPIARPVRDVETITAGSCLTAAKLEKYAGGRPLWAWEISQPVEYKEVRRIADYGLKRPPQSWRYGKKGAA